MWRFPIGLCAFAAALSVVPFVSSSYAAMATRDALLLAMFALSYDLLWGKSGTLTLGHAVFFGLGAYGLAVFTTKLGWSPGFALLAAIGLAAAIAAAFGYFLLFAGVRLHFFAVMTIALLLIARQLSTSWQSVTGGDVGIMGIPSLELPWFGGSVRLDNDLATYFTALAAVIAATLVVWLITRGTYGKVLAAISMNEFRARHCGFRTSGHLLSVFIGSAALAGLAGGLYATMAGVVAPDLFSILLSTEVILWVAIGGRGTLLGPVVAAVLITRIQQEVSSYHAELWPLILGTAFLVFVITLPNGFMGLQPWRAISRVFRRPPTSQSKDSYAP